MAVLKRFLACCAAAGLAALLAGCGSGSQPDASEPSATPAPAASAAAPKNDAISAVNQSLEAGNFDHAAARLLEIRASGTEMTPAEAADYRTALEDAYSRALEAAQKGDPRAQATLQMIKAATAR